MKILYHHRTASRDGQAVHIEELISALRRLGCEVVVVEPPQTAEARFGEDAKGLSSLRTKLPKFVSELLELAYSLVAYRRMKRAYIQHRPDVLYERHNLYLMAGVWLKRKFGLPYLVEVNAPLYLERSQHGGLALASLARRLELAVWRTADAVLPVTQVLADMLAAEGVSEQRLHVIPNGINLDAFASAPKSPEAKARLGLQGKLVLGFTGFVRDWHGLDQVIDFIGASGRTDLVLLVVGDGPARRGLEAHAQSLGLATQVRFTGIVDRRQIPAAVMAFDVALQPASTAYASPLKLFEYLALGRAIVAPDQKNLAEIVTHEENGLLFRPGDQLSLFKVLERLVNDDALRERLGTAARETITRRALTWDRNAERVVAEAQRLLAAKRAGSISRMIQPDRPLDEKSVRR
jgi:glycosyltransferase involved in cell wall biosynthesis